MPKPFAALILAAVATSAAVQAADAPPPVPREFRAAWVATVGNIDWPSRPGLTPEAQRLEASAILDVAKRAGLNAVVLQVRASADAFYDSPIEPWSAYLSGEQGKAPEPSYDPLAFWCAEAHRRGLLLHAWLNPFRARVAGARYEESAGHVAKARPDLVRTYGTMKWLDPGEPEARALTLKVVRDIARRYDVDGLHIDDYFYPYPIPDPDHPGRELDFPDDASWARAKAAGVTLDRADWRRDNINRLIEQMALAIKAEKPRALFGISPFGIPKPGQPPEVKGFDQYAKLYADAVLWVNKGWADYVSPQLYWKVDAPGQPFRPLLDEWIKANKPGRHVWPGLSISRVREGGNGYDPDEILRQIAIIREAPGAPGHVLFSFKTLPANRRGLTDKLREGPYRSPALVPPCPWVDTKGPGKPSVTPGPGGLTIRPGAGEAPFVYAIQSRMGEAGWTLAVIPAGADLPTFPPDSTGFVTAVDRLGNASEPIEINQK